MLGRGKRASKFLRQVTRGSVDKAIKEYEEILKQDDSNPDLWNTLGDLYLRAKNREKALECYEKSLDLYIKDGYTDNAIAVGKKILRYDPNRHMVHLQLARLYADPDIKNYKGALDEIRRFYETAQEVSIADLNQIMSLLSQIWEPLSNENAAENMPIFDNLFKLTEELIEQISMTGFDTQSTIPLTQMDLGKLEEEFGGPIEQEAAPEPMTEVESAEAVEAEPLQGEAPTLPEVEEVSAGEDLMAPPEPEPSREEPSAPEAPSLAELEELEEEVEEIQILDEASPTLTFEEEGESVEPSAPAPPASSREEEPEELRILEQAAAEESLNLDEEVEEVEEVVDI
ncbi:MAG: tetratricopeptide repeat protein, partial [Candidatus Hydrothermae bacterium]|nr:tetratricopeptide repeat protein [Candidatus Hydrothermae bacterium]